TAVGERHIVRPLGRARRNLAARGLSGLRHRQEAPSALCHRERMDLIEITKIVENREIRRSATQADDGAPPQELDMAAHARWDLSTSAKTWPEFLNRRNDPPISARAKVGKNGIPCLPKGQLSWQVEN